MGRVAIYVPSLEGGGAERVMVTLANEFAARELDTDLVLVRARGPYLKDVSSAVRVVDLGASRVLASVPALIRYLRRERPRSMLSALNHANLAALFARRLARVPVRLVVSERNTLGQAQASEHFIKRPFMPRLMRKMYPEADAVVAVSHGVAEDLASVIQLPKERIHVIYNPFNIERIRRLSLDEPDDARLARDRRIILGVGRLTAQKDFATLIEAVARTQARDQLQLVILGEGELRDSLEALAKELGVELLMPGFVANPYAWMRVADLFVLSSRWEGLPGVLIEAMACGTRVVATDCPSGPREILEDGKWGRLVPVGDVAGLARAIESALEEDRSPDVTTRASFFSIDRAVNAYLRALDVERY